MILLIDNYDSFTFNIFQYIRRMGHQVKVARNDEITVDEIEVLNPSHIVISPGPGTPRTAGNSTEIVKSYTGKIPILGICLGHQCIGSAFGASIVRAARLYHGKISRIEHDNRGIFSNISNPFPATRYHSLVIEKVSVPPQLEISAHSEDGEIMALRHKRYSVTGLQFHPESIGTGEGFRLLENFLKPEHNLPLVRPAIQKMLERVDLTEEESEKVMDEITSGQATPAQIASFLTGLSIKGETVSELAGFVRVMRRKATPVKRPEGRKVVDTCGTGGDSSGTFNISTVSAFVTAGAGITVAKHGNRSVTSRCGSADLLEALGVNIHLSPQSIQEALDEIGIAFLFAPNLHGSMKHAVPVRRDMGVRTAFNILGPLSNPAGADCQVIGVFDSAITEKIAGVLVRLGTEKAMVVHGGDGLDEITLTGETKVSEVNDGWIRNYSLDPADYGFQYCEPGDLKGGGLKTNCEIALSVMEGEKGPRRDVVILNSAAAIYSSGMVDNFEEAVLRAGDSLDSGAALKKLEELIEYSGS